MEITKINFGRIRKNFLDPKLAGRDISIEKHVVSEWGYNFGRIGNYQYHTQISDLFVNGTDYLPNIEDIFEKPQFDNTTWYTIVDLFKQAYILSQCWEVYNHGGHIIDNATTQLVTDKAMCERINKDVRNVLNNVWSLMLARKIK